AVVFLVCGLGLPIPEEVVLLFAGYVCFLDVADRHTMMLVCIGAILAGDLIPFALGRIYGPRLLRLRLMHLLVTPERLARFDRWFRRRGELVVLISRFIAGIRVVSFFTAGTMKMSWTRFLLLDLAGIVPIAIGLVWLGDHYGRTIQAVIEHVQSVERGILIAALSAAALLGAWYWLRWHRRQRLLVGEPGETYVEPSGPVRVDVEDVDEDAGDEAAPRERPLDSAPAPAAPEHARSDAAQPPEDDAATGPGPAVPPAHPS